MEQWEASSQYPKRYMFREIFHHLKSNKNAFFFAFFFLKQSWFIFAPFEGDPVSNHLKPYWPTEATTASDSEDPGGPDRLRVETKVNVELHTENKLNHISEREREALLEKSKQTPTSDKDVVVVSQSNTTNHQPEQRKGEQRVLVNQVGCLNYYYLKWSNTNHPSCAGILKNKISYPPPLTDKNMKNRLREKLSDYNSPAITSPPPNNNITAPPSLPSVNIMTPLSRAPSQASNDGNHNSSTLIKPPIAPRPQLPLGAPPAGIYQETNGGVAMHLKSGTVNGGNESDSE